MVTPHRALIKKTLWHNFDQVSSHLRPFRAPPPPTVPPLRKKIRQALFEWLPKLSLQKNIIAIPILITIIIIMVTQHIPTMTKSHHGVSNDEGGNVSVSKTHHTPYTMMNYILEYICISGNTYNIWQLGNEF